MKTQSAELAAHRALGTTSLAWCWKVTRKDEQVFGFTSVDIDLPIDGVTYKAATGFTPSAIEGKLDLSVPNLEMVGAFSADVVTYEDLLAGVWDDAEIEIFEVNHQDLSQGVMNLRKGKVGNFSAGTGTFTAEGRGLAQALQQTVGQTYAAACSATFGDSRCGKDAEALKVAGTVTAVASFMAFTDSSRVEASDYFGAGLVRWLTGDNAGLSMEVASFASGVFTLCLPMAHAIAVGDTFEAIPGCRKRRTEDCHDKHENVINFRGYPDVPLNDKVLGFAGVARE